eukprot:816369-Prorocentrum_minimum.AAC.1
MFEGGGSQFGVEGEHEKCVPSFSAKSTFGSFPHLCVPQLLQTQSCPRPISMTGTLGRHTGGKGDRARDGHCEIDR